MRLLPSMGLPAGAIPMLSLAAFASALSLRVTDAQLPLIAAEFGVGLGAAASVITAFSIAYGAAQLLFGPVGDRFGKYRVVAWGCVACALTAALCGLASGFAGLVAARLAAGATAASIIPLSMAWIGDVVPYERRQPVLARFMIGQVLGVSSGLLVGGYAADHLGWRLPFFGIAATFAVIAAVLLSIQRRLPPEATLTVPPSGGSAVARLVEGLAHVLRQGWARFVVASVFLEGACVFGALAFVPAHLHQRFGLSLAAAGAILMLFGLGGLLFALAVTPLVRRFGEPGLAAGGAALMAASLLAIALAPSWTWAVPASLLCGLGFYALHNTLQTNATQMAPQRRGAAVSCFAACYYLGQSIGVAAGGALIQRVGSAALIAGAAVAVLAVGLVFSRGRARRRGVTA